MILAIMLVIINENLEGDRKIYLVSQMQ